MNHVHITQGSGKMLGVPSINTPTTTNEFCQFMQKTNSICKSCYAQRYEKIRPSLVEAPTRNLFLVEKYIEPQEIPAINAQVFRFHSYGELHNQIHLQNYFTIAQANPRTIFTLWTKRYGIVQRVLKTIAKPANMIIIYSSPVVGKIARLPKGFDKVFTAHNKDTSSPINCHGSCNDCRLCYSHNDVAYINEIKK